MFVSFTFQGVDWGGLRREWFELLCKALFSHEAGFFSRFDADDPQALVSAGVFGALYCFIVKEQPCNSQLPLSFGLYCIEQVGVQPA